MDADRTQNNMPPLIPARVCLDCRECCLFPGGKSPWRARILKEEIAALREGPEGRAGGPFREQMIDRHFIKAVPHKDCARCVLLAKEDHSCLIYRRRPFECRFYPFVFLNKHGTVLVSVHVACPFVRENRCTRAWEDYVGKLRDYCHQPDVLSLVGKNPWLAYDYDSYKDEAEDLFELEGVCLEGPWSESRAASARQRTYT